MINIWNEAQSLIMAGTTGIATGLFFFAGLWWTIRNGLSAKHPALVVLGSFVLRMSVTLAGFYFASGLYWERLMACVAGFLAARIFVTWLMQRGEINFPENRSAAEKEKNAT